MSGLLYLVPGSSLGADGSFSSGWAPDSLFGTSKNATLPLPHVAELPAASCALGAGQPLAAALLSWDAWRKPAELSFVGPLREKPLSIHPARFNGQSNDTRAKNSCWVYSEVSVAGCKGELWDLQPRRWNKSQSWYVFISSP